MLLKCVCKNEYQDSKYGFNIRVHNPCKPKEKVPFYRCTVCLSVKEESSVKST